MKHLSKIFISLFLLLCLIPSVGMVLGFESAAGANEILSPAPRFGLNMLNETADYVADRFALRQHCITLWSGLNEKLLRTSAEDQVLLGKDGFLYFSETLDDYTGAALSDGELRQIAQRLADLQQELEAEGKAFVFTIAPNKNSLYPDRMPENIENRHENGNAVRLIPYLAAYGVHYADLFAPLSQELLYFRTDTHWTARGAALGADTLLAALGRNSDYAAHRFGQEGLHKGDLYEMLYPTLPGREAETVDLSGLSFRALGDINGGNAVTIRTESDSGSGKLLCWRDSFGIALYPYLADAFETATFSRAADYDLSRFADAEYDTVILEIVERNLPRLVPES